MNYNWTELLNICGSPYSGMDVCFSLEISEVHIYHLCFLGEIPFIFISHSLTHTFSLSLEFSVHLTIKAILQNKHLQPIHFSWDGHFAFVIFPQAKSNHSDVTQDTCLGYHVHCRRCLAVKSHK